MTFNGWTSQKLWPTVSVRYECERRARVRRPCASSGCFALSGQYSHTTLGPTGANVDCVKIPVCSYSICRDHLRRLVRVLKLLKISLRAANCICRRQQKNKRLRKRRRRLSSGENAWFADVSICWHDSPLLDLYIRCRGGAGAVGRDAAQRDRGPLRASHHAQGQSVLGVCL